MVLLCFLVDLSLYVISNRALEKLEGSQRFLHPLEGEHLKEEWTSPSVSTWLVENIWFMQLLSSVMIGWIIGGRVHRKSSAMKVAHPTQYYSGLRW